MTSRFYYDQYPDWVRKFNASDPAKRYADKHWELLHARDQYQFADLDDMPWETSLGSYGRVFPHPFGSRDDKLFTILLTISPAGDELTLDFAKQLIENESLGADSICSMRACRLAAGR